MKRINHDRTSYPVKKRVRPPSRKYGTSPPPSYRRRPHSSSHDHRNSPSVPYRKPKPSSIRNTPPRKKVLHQYKTTRPRKNAKKKIIIGGGFLLISSLIFVSFLFIFPNNSLNENINNEQEWKFVVTSDSQDNDPDSDGGHPDVLKSIAKNTPDHEFILSAGDVVQDGRNENHWIKWKNWVDLNLGSTGQTNNPPKYIAAPGNHDDNGDGWLQYWNKYLSGQTRYGNNGAFFIFDHKNARFIIINSNDRANQNQLNMLNNAINNNPKTWLIAIWHHPLLSYYDDFWDQGPINTWAASLYEAGCDFIFNGHIHQYVRSKKLELIEGEPPKVNLIRGTVHMLVGNGGARTNNNDPAGPHKGLVDDIDGDNNPDSYYTQHGYTELKIKGDKMLLRHFSTNGIIVDEKEYVSNPKRKEIKKLNNIYRDDFQMSYFSTTNNILTNPSHIRTEINQIKDFNENRKKCSKQDTINPNIIFIQGIYSSPSKSKLSLTRKSKEIGFYNPNINLIVNNDRNFIHRGN